jgi:hypothetical protein
MDTMTPNYMTPLLLSSRTSNKPVRTSSRPFRFFDLPFELRRCVYEHLLTSSVLVQPPQNTTRSAIIVDVPCPLILPRPVLSINILLANRSIHEEASRILYTVNTFHFQFPKKSAESHSTYKFLNAIGPSNCALITSAELFFNLYEPDIGTFPNEHIRLLTGLSEADVIVGITRVLGRHRGAKVDGEYLHGMVRSLIRELPTDCLLKWDVSGMYEELEMALESVYGFGGYRKVETQTKKNMIFRLPRTSAETRNFYGSIV